LREWSRWKEVVGKVGVIDGKTVSVCLIDNNKYDINFTDEMLELADKKETHKFKVGDKVRMINPNPRYGLGDVRVGSKGIIKSTDNDNYIVGFPKQSYWKAEEKDIEFLGENKKEETYVIGCEPYWTQYLLAEPITNFPKREKGLLMTGLKKVTNLIEGLKQPRQDYVRLDWVEIEDDEYVVTELGEEAQSDVAFGLVKHPTLAEYAKSEVARLVKEEKSSK